VAEGVGQAESEGLQKLQLLDGLLVRERQDAQCAPAKQQEDKDAAEVRQRARERKVEGLGMRVRLPRSYNVIYLVRLQRFSLDIKCLNKEG